MSDKIIQFEQSAMSHLLQGLPEMGPEYENAGPPMTDEQTRPDPVIPEGFEAAPAEAKVMVTHPDGTTEYLTALDVEARVRRLILAEFQLKQLKDIDLEALADLEHERWSHWMGYLFSLCTYTADGDAVIPKASVLHWQRQMGTPYADLTEREKESDRIEVRKTLALLGLQSK